VPREHGWGSAVRVTLTRRHDNQRYPSEGDRLRLAWDTEAKASGPVPGDLRTRAVAKPSHDAAATHHPEGGVERPSGHGDNRRGASPACTSTSTSSPVRAGVPEDGHARPENTPRGEGRAGTAGYSRSVALGKRSAAFGGLRGGIPPKAAVKSSRRGPAAVRGMNDRRAHPPPFGRGEPRD
jgi:hypothetical protein